MCGQHDSFSIREQMFLWNCRSLLDNKCLDLRWTPITTNKQHLAFSIRIIPCIKININWLRQHSFWTEWEKVWKMFVSLVKIHLIVQELSTSYRLKYKQRGSKLPCYCWSPSNLYIRTVINTVRANDLKNINREIRSFNLNFSKSVLPKWKFR